MDDFLQDFVRESEENITELNNALLELESDPEDEAAMDQIFRTAHTLKGNFGAMGFADASALAHAIEDLLDELREDRRAVTPEVMDLVFEGVDEIEAILREVEAAGEVSRDPGATIERIRTLMDGDPAPSGEPADEPTATGDSAATAIGDASGDDPAADGPTADDADAADGPTADALAALDGDVVAPDDGRVLHVAVEMAETQMKGVDAMFVLNDVTDAFDLLGARPAVEAIQDGEYDDGFDVFVGADSPTAVEDAFGDLGKVAAAAVTDVTDRLGAGSGGASESPADGDGTETGPSTGDSAATPGEASADGGGESDAEPPADGESDRKRAGGGELDGTDGDGKRDEGKDGDEKPTPGGDQIKSIRVDVEQLDQLHGLVEQLVTSRIKLRRSVEQGKQKSAEDNLDELDKITSSLQDTVMDMRLVPMKRVVSKFPRLVRDLARSQGKEISFELEGEEIELDRTILNEISDPLMHLLRNAADHGIESPEEREAAGKPREGTIQLRGERDRDRVTIEVEDDGRGLDVASIRRKAVEKGIASREEVDELEEEEVFQLVFHAGFSTTDEVTDVSGRGVGMDVVRNTIRRLDGTIDVESEPGEGTTVSLTLPVTVAIVKVLFVESGGEEYGIPIKNVDEISRVAGIKSLEGKEVVTHEDSVYPLIRLGEALDVPGATRNGDGMLVRIRRSERQVALHCDRVSRQEEVVVKPFEGILSGIPGLSGAAVLGEGDVVTILDVGTL